MRIGIFAGEVAGRGGVDELVAAARQAADDGFAAFWVPQIFGVDALTTLAVIGHQVPGIELGTSVVPTYPRHPMMLAQQALTTQAATGGRLTLGIGLSHQIVIESMYGMSFAHPLRHMREYLAILLPLIEEGSVSFAGETLTAHGAVSVPGAEPCPVLIAALGPKMLELAGAVAGGTITWMTGPATVGSHTVPRIHEAAAAAGRPEPRIAVGLPMCVTDDVSAARERAAKVFEIYGSLPSYRAMLDREGADGPADVAIIGDEDEVQAGLAKLAAAGATDLAAVEFGDEDDKARTRALLRSLV
ncbi:TIGR03564 family F420-dependent LLM class oxidoreductase [soil metagenome]